MMGKDECLMNRCRRSVVSCEGRDGRWAALLDLQAKQDQVPPDDFPCYQIPLTFAACGTDDFKAVSLQKIPHAPFRCCT
jgi:hypothetical protein